MAKPREYFKFNFSKVVKFDCTCGRRYINTDKCLQETDSRMPQTRADVIRSMSDEELAEFIDSGCPDCARLCPDFKAGCSWTCQHNQGKDFLIKWLQSEAE